ncbi:MULTISPECIES: MFS transporter [unclassified Streptomyces]|uniref:CynX/NimT family MFS transporter n=1 Tax=unclassified Streptomyces TaxID=2593676 RepID=UPI00224F330D|nr:MULTISPECIES: MFS transporter [unclassified Streptomyces]MCX4525139.1 MFS transporter [Streptomyces sp. NBC_01551]MCX4544349.1 MFS transporter [Streptomyces sp. NBC_01565]
MLDDEIQTLNRPRAPRTEPSRPARVPVPAAAARQPAWLGPVLIVGIVLAALNLRPAITSLGALFEETRTGLGMSGTVAGLITSVPTLCFAVFGVTAPRLSRRFGPAAVVCAGMAAIAAGLLIRPFASNAAGFLAASALSLAGIALTNVLLPVIVKRWFPDRVGTMTGLYSMALAAGTSLAAAATVPLTSALGGSWRTGLLIWAVLALAAVLPWLPVAAVSRRERAAAEAASPAAPAPAVRADSGPRVVRSRTAWALACYFGLQATGAYVTMGWLPQIFRDAGVSAGTAGVLLAVTMVMGVPLAFVIPGLAGRMRNQGPIAVTLGLFGLAGYLGLYLAPAAGAWAWALLLGISNCAFPLVITMIGLRAKSPAGVVKLSAFAQSTGYLISIPGPILIGTLYQHSGGWDLPLVVMACLLVPQIALGVLAGRDRTIEGECGVRD